VKGVLFPSPGCGENIRQMIETGVEGRIWSCRHLCCKNRLETGPKRSGKSFICSQGFSASRKFPIGKCGSEGRELGREVQDISQVTL